MERLGVLTAVTGLFLLLLNLPGSPVLAANATTLDVTAPSAADINEWFSVNAAYKSNDTSLCGATCRVGGGWLSEYVYLDEILGCEYLAIIYAPGYSGSHTLDMYCEKAGYDYQSVGFDIDIEKLESRLLISVSPQSPRAGDAVTVSAYYEDDYNNAIQGSCSAELEENGIEIEDIGMSYYGDIYTGELSLPPRTGDYTVTVTCTSEQYETESKDVALDVRKEQADLDLSYPKPVYYGQSIEINAAYTHLGSMISGSCAISFNGAQRQMGYSYAGYRDTVTIPYAAGQHRLGVECTSDRYETVKKEILITPFKRPARVVIASPIQRTFYPTDKITVKVSYADSLAGEGITDAACFLDGSRQLRAEGGYHVAEVSNLGIGAHALSIKCSEQFHEESTGILAVDVVRIPVDIQFAEARNEYRCGEDIEIKASVASIAGGDADVSCRARVDSYGALFNNLLDYYTANMTLKDGMHALTIKDPGRPSRMAVTVTCSGDVYEEGTARIEFTAKQLSRETEEGAVLLLSAVSVALVALILLIRRKLKIL
jgi:hypothetical protein